MPKYLETRDSGHYRVRIPFRGERIAVGTFTSEAEAVTARDEKLKVLGLQAVVEDGLDDEPVIDPQAPQGVDEEDVYRRALAQNDRLMREFIQRETRVLQFPGPVVALAFLADQHLDDPGCNLSLAFDDLDTIMSMPSTWIITLGDLLNSFVVGNMRAIRDSTTLSQPDALVLARRYMKRMAARWKAAVAGNHDLWIELLTGVDFIREEALKIAPELMWDSYDCSVTVRCGNAEYPGRLRHAWKGRSQYSASHGIELAARFDGGFRWAVGGHYHAAGLIREFNQGGQTCIAAIGGSYKRIDSYVQKIGFPAHNPNVAVVICFDDAGHMQGFSDLDVASRYMKAISRSSTI